MVAHDASQQKPVRGFGGYADEQGGFFVLFGPFDFLFSDEVGPVVCMGWPGRAYYTQFVAQSRDW